MGRTCCRWCVPACGSLMECRWNVSRKRIGRTPPDHATRSTTIDNFSLAPVPDLSRRRSSTRPQNGSPPDPQTICRGWRGSAAQSRFQDISTSSPLTDLPAALAAGLRDRYVLERELGRGGMATVYLARDVRHRRAVAVKVLRPELAAVLGPERFLREIEVAAQLNHPHILQLYDSGEAGGFLYYVMPLVDGESLRDRLERERQLPVEDALQIVREVADALAFAHSRRVVHRDVKPENILLAGGHAVIADFGIARAVTAAGGERLTQTGVSLGTPAYMSPEQWAGDEGLDGRSDLYSLGCVLYETLMGEPPFAGSSPQVILARQSMERIPSIRLVRPNVPPAVEAAITRAIAKLPADRFATTLQFAEALVAAPAAPSPEAAARPVPSRPFRRRAAAGVAIGVLLLGGTLGG